MNTDFYNKIAKSNAGTNSRNSLKKLVLDNSNLIVDLIQIATTISDKNHHKAVWIIEMIAETNATLLTPYLTKLIACFPKYKHQSAIRGMSRVAYFISLSDKIALSESDEGKK